MRRARFRAEDRHAAKRGSIAGSSYRPRRLRPALEVPAEGTVASGRVKESGDLSALTPYIHAQSAILIMAASRPWYYGSVIDALFAGAFYL